MEHFSPDRRFELHHHSRDDDSYMYSYTDYEWYVTSVETGDELYRFSGSDNQDQSGRTQKGTQDVAFEADGRAVVESLFDGGTKRHPLPAKIELKEDGRILRLTFEDGTVEDRPRQRLIITSKYGEPFVVPLKSEPGAKPRESKMRKPRRGTPSAGTS